MSVPLLSIAALSILTAHVGFDQDEVQPTTTLSQYIQSLHWNAAKSGPLLAIQADRTNSLPGQETGLSAFQLKMVKAGAVSVICLNWTIALEDSDLPNAYQSLTSQEKLIFLLATLSQPDLAKLTGKGIAAAELSGEQRLALLSLIPNPLKIVQGQVFGNGFSTSGDPKPFPRDQVDNIRLQFHKGVELSYNATTVSGGANSVSNLSGLDYNGPAGSPITRTNQAFGFSESNQMLGRVADSAEKKSNISWNDPRLSNAIELKSSALISEVVDATRKQTGVEVYADARIGGLTLNVVGSSASARDLLRGLALAVGGVYRKVGPAFILTAEIEGDATREARVQLHRMLALQEIQPELARWKADVAKRGLFDKLGFARNDPFAPNDISASDFAPPGADWDSNWVPLSHLPQTIQDAVNHAGSIETGFAQTPKPTPVHQGMVKVTSTFGFRLVLPDGRPLESHSIDPNDIKLSEHEIGIPPTTLPVDPKALPPGSAVGIKSDNPDTVSKLCGMIKEIQVPEVWLETQAPEAIRAAVESGLLVDLMVHPWRLLRGETCQDPDRNVLGQTGAHLSQIPGALVDPVTMLETTFADSYSPESPGLARHWEKLATLVRTPGIHRLIVLEAEPGGYEGFVDNGFFLGAPQMDRGLQGNVPALFQFGYSTALRLQFIRKYHEDPIDILDTEENRLSPPSPYFDLLGGLGNLTHPFPDVQFPELGRIPDDRLRVSWSSMRQSLAAGKLSDLMDMVKLVGVPVFVEDKTPEGMSAEMTPLRTVTGNNSSADPKAPKLSTVQYLAINPLNAEDEQGVMSWKPFIPPGAPFCFDLGEVPVDRMGVFLRYVFRVIH